MPTRYGLEAEPVSLPACDRSGLLRRVLLMVMFTAGCIAGLALATATPVQASARPQSPTTPAGLANTLGEMLDRTTVLPPRLRPSPHAARLIPGLVRTVEDVPGTPHPAARTVTVTAGETPRVLDRTDQAAAHYLADPAHAPASYLADPTHPRPPARLTEPVHTPAAHLTDSARAPAAHLAQRAHARRATHFVVHTHAQPPAHLVAAQRWVRGHHLLRHLPVRSGMPTLRRHRAPATSNDHRTPWPYAPTTPASVIAGPAVSSSNAAGPAFLLPGAGVAQRLAMGFPSAPIPVATQPRSIAHAPGHTPD